MEIVTGSQQAHRCLISNIFECERNLFEIENLKKSISKFECSTENMFDVSQDGNSILGVFAGDNCKIICENLETKEAIIFQDAHNFMVGSLKLVEDRNKVISGSFFNSLAIHEFSSGNKLIMINLNQFCLQNMVRYDRFLFLGFTESVALFDLETHRIKENFIKFFNKNVVINELYRDPQVGGNSGYHLVLGGSLTTSLKVYNVDGVFEKCPPLGEDYYNQNQPVQPEEEDSLGELGSDQEIELDMSDFSLNDVEEGDLEEVD